MSASDMADMAMDDMPCCPHKTPAMPDCSKGCPLAALCLATIVFGVPSGISLPMRIANIQDKTWDGEAPFDSLAQAPPAEPPRS